MVAPAINGIMVAMSAPGTRLNPHRNRVGATLEVDSPTRMALLVLALATLMNMASRGIGESFAVFLLPIANEFGADRAAMTGVYSTYMAVIGLMSPFAGVAVDRLGARRCYFSGVVILGTTYLLAAQLQSLWQLYLLIGGMSALGSTLISMVPASSLVSRWFGAKLPTAMGLLSAALGTGMLIVAPLAQAMVERFGWRGAYQGLGIAMGVLLVPMLFLPWRRIAQGSPEVVAASRARAAQSGGWDMMRALKTPLFWAMAAVMFVTSVTTYTVNVQLVAYLVESGFSPMQAAAIFGFVGVSSVVGMISAGLLAERIGERWVATVSYSATLAGIVLLALLPHWPMAAIVAAFVLTYGTVQGSRGPLIATLAARSFPGAMGRVYGMVMASMGAGAAVGSWVSGLLFDATGNYHAGFFLSSICALVGLALFWLVPGLSGVRGESQTSSENRTV